MRVSALQTKTRNFASHSHPDILISQSQFRDRDCDLETSDINNFRNRDHSRLAPGCRDQESRTDFLTHPDHKNGYIGPKKTQNDPKIRQN